MTRAATATACHAARLRSRPPSSAVIAKKIGIVPTGSVITSRVTKLLTRKKVSIMGTRWAGLVSGAGPGSGRRSGLDRQPVVEPVVLPSRPDPLVEGLCAAVVPGGLPDELGRAMRSALLHAGVDESAGHPGAPCLGVHEQVVHHPDAGGGQRLPGPEH